MVGKEKIARNTLEHINEEGKLKKSYSQKLEGLEL